MESRAHLPRTFSADSFALIARGFITGIRADTNALEKAMEYSGQSVSLVLLIWSEGEQSEGARTKVELDDFVSFPPPSLQTLTPTLPTPLISPLSPQ